MTARRVGPSPGFAESLRAILDHPATYELADCLPDLRDERGGRPRSYPYWVVVVYHGLVSVYTSARKVERELGHLRTWRELQQFARRRFPGDETQWLPDRPIRRGNYSYVRDRYMSEDDVWERLAQSFRRSAAQQAVDQGLCREDGPGSLTHPHLDRVIYGDGKVVTPLYRAKPGQRNKDTGQLLRSDPDAKLHITGSGEEAYGNKFTILACRSAEPFSRVILDVRWVETVGAEMGTAVEALDDVAPLLPGTQGFLYDGAQRGKHRQHILTRHGMTTISPPVALAGGRRVRKPRVERTVFVEIANYTDGAGNERTMKLYTHGGALGCVEFTEAGDPIFTRLIKRKVSRSKRSDGTWRWYAEYEVPADFGSGVVRVRLDTSDEDKRRRFHRAEHLRDIVPGDDDWNRVYSRRSDVESINRSLDDSMWIGRAHSRGARRQRADLLGFALTVNSISRYRAQASERPPAS